MFPNLLAGKTLIAGVLFAFWVLPKLFLLLLSFKHLKYIFGRQRLWEMKVILVFVVCFTELFNDKKMKQGTHDRINDRLLGKTDYDNEEGKWFRGRKGKIDIHEKWVSYPVRAALGKTRCGLSSNVLLVHFFEKHWYIGLHLDWDAFKTNKHINKILTCSKSLNSLKGIYLFILFYLPIYFTHLVGPMDQNLEVMIWSFRRDPKTLFKMSSQPPNRALKHDQQN